jgi:malate dehydrogenase (quinone)
MSMPHLDTRVITGKDWLLFGPFAGWSPKFLKAGKFTDLPLSVKPDNLLSMVGVGLTELPLVKYLVGELLQSFEGRVDTLRKFAPTAQSNDWELDIAGQRVQVIRRDAKKMGILEFGTTVLAAADGSIAGLLGASPGASTAVPAMLEVMQRCFPEEYRGWEPKIKEIVPSLGSKLSEEPRLFTEIWDHGSKVLGLQRRAPGQAEPAGVV